MNRFTFDSFEDLGQKLNEKFGWYYSDGITKYFRINTPNDSGGLVRTECVEGFENMLMNNLYFQIKDGGWYDLKITSGVVRYNSHFISIDSVGGAWMNIVIGKPLGGSCSFVCPLGTYNNEYTKVPLGNLKIDNCPRIKTKNDVFQFLPCLNDTYSDIIPDLYYMVIGKNPDANGIPYIFDIDGEKYVAMSFHMLTSEDLLPDTSMMLIAKDE